jgi:hypothetical protein
VWIPLPIASKGTSRDFNVDRRGVTSRIGARVTTTPTIQINHLMGSHRSRWGSFFDQHSQKIDVEGAEATILIPFFRDAPEILWPRFIIIEDTSGMWQTDLFSELRALGYMVASRSKLNVMMRR